MKSLRFVAAILVVGAVTACSSDSITGTAVHRRAPAAAVHGDGTGYMGGGGRMAASTLTTAAATQR